jgi:DDE_Tnp_1-associated
MVARKRQTPQSGHGNAVFLRGNKLKRDNCLHITSGPPLLKGGYAGWINCPKVNYNSRSRSSALRSRLTILLRASTMNLIEAIKSVPDHRHPRGIRHPLWLILSIILLGSCTGYWGYKPLAEFTKNHRSTLIKLFHLPPDIRFPCDSTFRNIILSLDFEVIAVLFNIWAQQNLPSAPG